MMNKRIFKSILLTSIAVLLASLVLILGVMYSYFEEQTIEKLKGGASYIKTGVEEEGISYLERMRENGNSMRVTWIGENGDVLFDNMANAKTMENHSSRAEVMDAKRLGVGKSVRYSVTLSERTINYAVLLEDDSVIRVSGTDFTILSLFMSMIYPIIVILIFAIMLSAFLAKRISQNITEPINLFASDNLEKEKIYEELKPIAKKLKSQNKQINMQMEELKLEHARQDKMRREFTANVSHELKTPLTSISGFAEIIRDGLVKAEDIPHFADNIYKETQRLINLVADILNLSRLEENTVPVQKEPIDLYEACEGVILSLSSKAREEGVSINLKGEHLSVLGTDYIIHEMIYNVIENAIKYNKKNGEVFVDIIEEENKIILSVKDTGVGISEDDINRVFERFYRANIKQGKIVEGTGLGLSIVKHAAIYHNAKIDIKSSVGVGTQIKFIFDK